MYEIDIKQAQEQYAAEGLDAGGHSVEKEDDMEELIPSGMIKLSNSIIRLTDVSYYIQRDCSKKCCWDGCPGKKVEIVFRNGCSIQHHDTLGELMKIISGARRL